MRILLPFILLLLSCSISACAQDTIPAHAHGRHQSPVFKSDTANDTTLMTFDGVKATSKINIKLIRKRNAGIGLTAAGLTMAAISSILITQSTWQTYTYPNGASYTNTTPGGIIGVLMIPTSICLTIPGAVLWGRNARKIRKAQRAK